MFRERFDGWGGDHIEGLSSLPRFELRKEVARTQALGERLAKGDWSVAEELCLMHMYLCAIIAKGVAHRHRQEVDEMVSWAYVGLVAGCRRIFVGEATTQNVTGYLICSAKSACINNRRDRATGLSQWDMAQYAHEGLPLPQRSGDLRSLEIPILSDEMAHIEFFDSFLPMLTDRELDVFCLLTKGYDEAEVWQELNFGRATFFAIRQSIERKFEKWMDTWYRR